MHLALMSVKPLFFFLSGPSWPVKARERRSAGHFATDSLCCSLVWPSQERSLNVPRLTPAAAPRTPPPHHPREWDRQHHPALRHRKRERMCMCARVVFSVYLYLGSRWSQVKRVRWVGMVKDTQETVSFWSVCFAASQLCDASGLQFASPPWRFFRIVMDCSGPLRCGRGCSGNCERVRLRSDIC